MDKNRKNGNVRTDSKTYRDGFIWNSIGGMLNALQSVVVLMVVTRTAGLTAAGIYSIAFATGNLFMYFGNYGVRNYQVSDLQEQFSFIDYLHHRYRTILLMLLMSVIYCVYHLANGSYSIEKTAVVFAMCVLKSIDCLEEVFEGRLHQKGHLDKAGKMMTVRLLVSIGGMLIILAMGGSLLVSVIAACILAFAAFRVMSSRYLRWIDYPVDTQTYVFDPAPVQRLMRICFPVCASNFLSFYLINAPKYAIDAVMEETAQARYNFIAMPVFVIQLLTMFIYQPVMVKMTQHWQAAAGTQEEEGTGTSAGIEHSRRTIRNKQFADAQRRKELSLRSTALSDFLKDFFRVVCSLLVVSTIVLLGAYFLGIPVLSILYATDLTDLKNEFMLLLAGSVFLAMNGFYNAVLTMMRLQDRIPTYYLVGTVVSVLLTRRLTQAAGIIGAVIAFDIVMILVCLMLTLQFADAIRNCGFHEKEVYFKS